MRFYEKNSHIVFGDEGRKNPARDEEARVRHGPVERGRIFGEAYL